MANPTLETQKQEVEQQENTERTRDRRAFTPRADIYETENEIVVLADVPGADEQSIDITLEKNVLTIRAIVEDDAREDGRKHALAYAEYGVGDYERSFVLPNEIDRAGIEAGVLNGVLRLHLPKAPESQPRKISVKAGNW